MTYYPDIMEQIVNWMDQLYFIHWKAWTGKSTFIKEFVENVPNTLVLATTWIAAINVGGSTLHSFFKIFENKFNLNNKYDPNYKVLEKTEYIIIDEVSMLRADLLETVDNWLRQITKTNMFMGWFKVIFVGDLYQLPPVVVSSEKEWFFDHYETEFFFWYPEIYNTTIKLIELEKVWRQDGDQWFLEILNKIRDWKQTYTDLKVLDKRVTKNIPENIIYLASTNKVVKDINETKLKENPNEIVISQAKITGDITEKYFPTDQFLAIKEGAQVISIINHPQYKSIKNWTMGIVKKIEPWKLIITFNITKWKNVRQEDLEIRPYEWELKEPVYNEEKEEIEYKEKWSFYQFPIKLAYAITIHKSQWLTFDKAYIDLWKFAFAKHMVYVALSRVKTLDWVFLKRSVYKNEIKVDEYIWKFLEYIKKSENNKLF